VKRSLFPLAAGSLITAAVLLSGALVVGATGAGGDDNAVLKAASEYKATGTKTQSDFLGRLSSAPLLSFAAVGQQAARAAAPSSGSRSGARVRTLGCQNRFGGGENANVRVNQDCSLRRQAEEVIAVNPTNRNNLIAGQNDSSLGFNHCGYDYSLDRGRTWGSMIPPFYGYLMGGVRTADACSDPTVTFDADGNAYIAGVLFDISDAASALVVSKSNANASGSYYHAPDGDLTSTAVGVVADNNFDPNVFHDKEFIVADAGASSPKKNNVYVTWTRFTAVNSPIYFSQSTDGGATWSDGVEISGSSATLCADFSATPDACDQDQGSHPIVGSDGTIYVAFGNGNTPDFGVNQVLFVKCPVGNDCTQAAGWSTPTKVNDLVGLHPIDFGGSVNGCPPGRQCLPPNGYRVPEFTSITTSVDRNGRLYVSWADFRNGTAGPCGTLDTATATPPCDNDVFYAYSTDGGATWSAAKKVSPAGSAQWQPWSDVRSDGRSLWIAYYDRSYGNCETTGCNDITAIRVSNPATASPSLRSIRVTTASMPNLVPPNAQAGFLGDYMWVEVDPGNKVHVVWADTRGKGNAGDPLDEDIYYATLDD
jgi:hypothetical protein